VATNSMRSLFNVTYVRLYVLNQAGSLLLFVDEKVGRFVVQPANFGIASTAISSRQTVSVPCAQNDPEYNRRPRS
jgi:hypothetical protein